MWIVWKNPLINENKRISVLRNMWISKLIINSSSRIYSIYPGKILLFIRITGRKISTDHSGPDDRNLRKHLLSTKLT